MLRDQISEGMKAAMRERDARTTQTLRMVMAAIKQADIEARPKGNAEGVSEDEVVGIIRKMIKQRRESIALYAQGGRQDLVDQETAEVAILERFLPQAMDAAAMAAAVEAAVAETGAVSVKDMGKVMAVLKARHAGSLDFAAVNPLVKARLAG